MVAETDPKGTEIPGSPDRETGEKQERVHRFRNWVKSGFPRLAEKFGKKEKPEAPQAGEAKKAEIKELLKKVTLSTLRHAIVIGSIAVGSLVGGLPGFVITAGTTWVSESCIKNTKQSNKEGIINSALAGSAAFFGPLVGIAAFGLSKLILPRFLSEQPLSQIKSLTDNERERYEQEIIPLLKYLKSHSENLLDFSDGENRPCRIGYFSGMNNSFYVITGKGDSMPFEESNLGLIPDGILIGMSKIKIPPSSKVDINGDQAGPQNVENLNQTPRLDEAIPQDILSDPDATLDPNTTLTIGGPDHPNIIPAGGTPETEGVEESGVQGVTISGWDEAGSPIPILKMSHLLKQVVNNIYPTLFTLLTMLLSAKKCSDPVLAQRIIDRYNKEIEGNDDYKPATIDNLSDAISQINQIVQQVRQFLAENESKAIDLIELLSTTYIGDPNVVTVLVNSIYRSVGVTNNEEAAIIQNELDQFINTIKKIVWPLATSQGDEIGLIKLNREQLFSIGHYLTSSIQAMAYKISQHRAQHTVQHKPKALLL